MKKIPEAFEHIKKAKMPRRSEIRKDYIQEKYVIIAPGRKLRPGAEIEKEIHIVGERKCVFCSDAMEKRKDFIYRSPDGKDWNLAVIPNIYPAVTLSNPKAYGVQEVIVETPKHDLQIEDLSSADITDIFKVYAERTAAVSKTKKIQYVLIFKNSGGRAGASIRHSHSQIFATSFLPPHILDKSARAMAFRFQHKACPYCEIAKLEREGARFIAESGGIVAFAPYASMHNYEVWLLPKRHLDNVMHLTEEERLGMATLLKKLLKKINALGLSYNYYFHQIVFDPDQHLYMKITPRGSVWAGVEIGSGLIINPIAPEEAAKYYRA